MCTFKKCRMTAPLPLLRTGVLYIFLHIVVNNNFLSYFINIFSLLSVVLRLWFFFRVFLTLIFLVYIIYKFISKLIHNTREHRRRQHAPSENICLLKMCKKNIHTPAYTFDTCAHGEMKIWGAMAWKM